MLDSSISSSVHVPPRARECKDGTRLIRSAQLTRPRRKSATSSRNVADRVQDKMRLATNRQCPREVYQREMEGRPANRMKLPARGAQLPPRTRRPAVSRRPPQSRTQSSKVQP